MSSARGRSARASSVRQSVWKANSVTSATHSSKEPADWQGFPEPGGPLIVGIDGGYVHARSPRRGEGWFEVIVGKSMPTDGHPKCFGFVSRLDTKPKRSLYDMLASQGFRMNQQVVFLSDGGDTVRDLQMRMGSVPGAV
jgi:hypothetical protein